MTPAISSAPLFSSSERVYLGSGERTSHFLLSG